MSFKKAKTAIAGSILAAVMAVSALGGSLIQAVGGSEYKSWKQYGSSWSSINLGSSGQSTAKIGCAVTSAAMLMVHSGSVTDESFTPGTIISYMNANGGFSSTGAINWNKLSGYAPNFVYVRNEKLSGTQQQKTDKMKSYLDEGYYLIAQVKYGGHFVAIDSIDGSNVIMMDPGSKSTSLFDKYAAGGVISLRLFRGANSQSAVPEETAPVEIPEPSVPETTAAAETVYETTIAEETTIAVTETQDAASKETTTETIITTTSTETTSTTVQTTTEAVTSAEPVTTEAETQPEAGLTEPSMPTTETVLTAPALPETSVQMIPEAFDELEAPPAPIVPVRPAPDGASVPTIIPSEAEAGLFEVGNQYYYMQVKFLTMDNIHLRETPDTDADILLLIPSGVYLDVVEVNEDYTWGRVNVNGHDGWISLNYTGI